MNNSKPGPAYELNPKHPDGQPNFMWYYGYVNREGEFLVGEAWGKTRKEARIGAKAHCAVYGSEFKSIETFWCGVRIAGLFLRRDQFQAVVIASTKLEVNKKCP